MILSSFFCCCCNANLWIFCRYLCYFQGNSTKPCPHPSMLSISEARSSSIIDSHFLSNIFIFNPSAWRHLAVLYCVVWCTHVHIGCLSGASREWTPTLHSINWQSCLCFANKTCCCWHRKFSHVADALKSWDISAPSEVPHH